MPGNKNSGPPGVPKTEEHKSKIARKQRLRVLSGENNLTRTDVCYNCGITLQANMIRRWHNERCRDFWSYKSKKLLYCK